MASLLPLLLLPLTARLLTGPVAAGGRVWIDALLAVTCGAAFAAISAFWVSRFHLHAPHISPDFIDYCGALGEAGLRVPGASSKRSQLCAELPLALWGGGDGAGWGLFDAFALASLLCAGVIGGSLYLWGRAISGRLAGLAAATAALAMGPLVMIPKMISFTPEIAAAFTATAAATAMAIRWGHPLALLTAAAGIGLSLLVDLRGLLWALSYLPALALALIPPRRGLRPTAWLRWALVLGLLLLPLRASWQQGATAYASIRHDLEMQADLRPRLFDMGVRVEGGPPYDIESSYIWGRTPITDVSDTLRFLAGQATLSKHAARVFADVRERHDVRLRPWRMLVALAGGLAVLGLARRPRALLALLVTCVPFLAAFRGMDVRLQHNARFFTQALPAVAVLCGVGFAGLHGLVPSRGFGRWLPRRLGGLLAAALAIGGLLAIVLGAVPSAASPNAEWRRVWSGPDSSSAEVLRAIEAGGLDRQAGPPGCEAALRADAARGLPWAVTVYGESR